MAAGNSPGSVIAKKVILLDTNVFIYLANGSIPASRMEQEDIAFSSITKIEALGYAKITVAEQSLLNALFEECVQLDLDENIIQRAIRLRQLSKMSLGDSIVAASALENNLTLWTANLGDFNAIDGLNLVNPLSDVK